MTLPTPAELNEQLTSQEETLPSMIELTDLLWKTTTQCQTLLKENKDQKISVKLTSSPRRFTPHAITFVRAIRFYCEDPEKTKNSIILTVKTVSADARKIDLLTSKDKKYAFAFITEFCEWFEIHTDASVFKPRITKIQIPGATLAALEQYATDIEKYNTLKSASEKTIASAELKYQGLLTSIEESESQLDAAHVQLTEYHQQQSDADIEIAKVRHDITEKTVELNQLEAKQKHATEQLAITTNNFQQLSQKSTNLNKEISNLSQSLEKLTSDRNLISDEYGPYVKEGKSQATIYTLIATLPLIAIIFSIYEIYAGASKLLLTEYHTASEIFSAFILRIPFALVFATAIYYSWKLTVALVTRVFTIHNDRLTLAKLLIVAREVVHSSTRNLKISDHEKFQEQVTLKVEVLKSHLAKELGNDFEYKPTKINSTPNDQGTRAANDSDGEVATILPENMSPPQKA